MRKLTNLWLSVKRWWITTFKVEVDESNARSMVVYDVDFEKYLYGNVSAYKGEKLSAHNIGSLYFELFRANFNSATEEVVVAQSYIDIKRGGIYEKTANTYLKSALGYLFEWKTKRSRNVLRANALNPYFG